MPRSPIIAIDPGHGMSNRVDGRYDPGAVARSGATEADIVLLWALTLKHVLTQSGYRVFMVRDDATDHAPVASRDNRASDAGAGLYISLHCNAAAPNVSGTEVFHRVSHNEKRLADAVNKALRSPEVIAHHPSPARFRDRGVKSDRLTQHGGLAVLNFGPPACLVELAFISNTGDLKFLLSREARIAFARALVRELKLANFI